MADTKGNAAAGSDQSTTAPVTLDDIKGLLTAHADNIAAMVDAKIAAIPAPAAVATEAPSEGGSTPNADAVAQHVATLGQTDAIDHSHFGALISAVISAFEGRGRQQLQALDSIYNPAPEPAAA